MSGDSGGELTRDAMLLALSPDIYGLVSNSLRQHSIAELSTSLRLAET